MGGEKSPYTQHIAEEMHGLLVVGRIGLLGFAGFAGTLASRAELQVVNSKAAFDALVPAAFTLEDFNSFPETRLTGATVELFAGQDTGITVSGTGASGYHRIGTINFGDAGIDSAAMQGNYLIGRADADDSDAVRIDFPFSATRHNAIGFDYSGAIGGQGNPDGALFKYRVTTGNGSVTESVFPADDGYIGFFDPVCPIVSIEFVDTKPNGMSFGEGWAIDSLRVTLEALPDSDGDGMPDLYEDEIAGLDSAVADGDGDLDGDTLTNVEEFLLCTDPNKTDTDGDGLDDPAESNSGIFVSPADPGTNPALADTDGDGIPDGAETNTGVYVDEDDTGTDPNNPDTDGDGFGDGIDPDPNNGLVFPSVIFGGGTFTTTHVWNAGTINDLFTAETVTADDNIQGERITVETPLIHFHDNVAPPIFMAESKPYPLWDPENGGAGFGDRNDFAIRSVGQIKIRPPGGTVTFVCNSDDGFALRIDGEEIGQVGNRGRGNTFMTADLDPGIHDLEFIHWERGGGAGVTVAVLREFNAQAPPAFGGGGEAQWELLTAHSDSDTIQIKSVRLIDGMLRISWVSDPTKQYDILANPDLSTAIVNWPELAGAQDIPADPSGINTVSVALPYEGIGFVAVREEDPPPTTIYEDDLEGGQGEWTVGSDGEAGTSWEFGVPGAPGPTEANSPTTCFGTNLTGNYGLNAEVWLRSPTIDLSGAGGATLIFSEYKDIEEGFDFGTISVLDAADDSVLAVIADAVDGIDSDWEIVRKPIPAEGLGREIKIEFRFKSDELENFAGWYIDDVMVTVP